ncbi:hypothetical protein [Pleurocapsa sp. PCC 7319]|uniref:hypothetical protein n=1 Tax=Pleurocapsa sp. PCC 7319 TaxID=118161 RepID=UPI00034B7297|nr:hypothetical protein [Pleurocapsa sp. PCC 7319]
MTIFKNNPKEKLFSKLQSEEAKVITGVRLVSSRSYYFDYLIVKSKTFQNNAG